MFNRSVLKLEAKSTLQGNWGRIGGYMLVLYAISMGIGFIGIIPFVGPILATLIGMLVTLGMMSIGLGVIKRADVTIDTAFAPFSYGLKGIGIMLWTTLWLTIWALPGGAIIFIGIIVLQNTNAYMWTDVCLIVGYLAILIMIQIKTYSYRLAPYVLIENPEKPIRQAFREAIEMTEGYKWNLFILDLSFIGWAILATMTCGIGLFWLIPYQQTVCANAYLHIKHNSWEQDTIDRE